MEITIPARIVEVTFAEYVGGRIRQRRQQLGLTMDDVISQMDISKAYLSEVETGKRSIGFKKLYYLAQVLGRKTDWFAQGWDD